MQATRSVDIQDQYMTLLVTQLQNQDPLEPVSQENFINQVTQFSNLAGMEQLNASFSEMLQLQTDALRLQEMSASANLVGRVADYRDTSDNLVKTGVISGLEVADSRVRLQVGEGQIAVDQIVAIR